MTNLRVTMEPAYVLHARPYRDSSLIVDVLTGEYGRIALVARGARRPKSSMHGLLQPFTPLLASWSMRRELGTLTAAEPRGCGGLRGRALINGLYINELLMRLLHRNDPHPGIFSAYEAAIRGLAGAAVPEPSSPAGEQIALRLFEKALLREIGYGLVLDHEVMTGGPIRADAIYYYYPERGPVPADAAAVDPGSRLHQPDDASRQRVPAPGGAVRLSGRCLLALAREELYDPQSLQEAKRLMRAALGVCLGSKPLNSRDLFRRPGASAPGTGQEI